VAVLTTRVLTANWGVEGSHTLAVYRERGGYTALTKALEMEPKDITELVKASGLRGRGGAGFPTGTKWTFVPPPERRGGKPVYLICNADESEPGTFKDRFCMWNDPHLLIEGCVIACLAIGSGAAYIYLRGEFKYVKTRLDAAIAEARAAGIVGEDVMGSGREVQVYTHLGAGAYICGEETGLISSLEGGRGQPKLKPPFPAVEGAWACPTIVNNVETLQVVPWVLNNGADAYKAMGTERSTGTKLFSVSGHVNKPGVYEIDLGMPMKDFIEQVCGGVRGGWDNLKAVIPGGSSVPVMTKDEVEKANMDYESINAVAGSYLGSGGMIVMDKSVDMVRALTNLLRFYAHESCGQCTPCREGVGWMYQILTRLDQGVATDNDVAILKDLADNIHSKTICFFGASAAMPVQSFLQKYREEFMARIERSTGGLAVPTTPSRHEALAK
jgi:NADH-quinone oxidoreductase subunit F